jgi:Uncharacterized Fe-S center protein
MIADVGRIILSLDIFTFDCIGCEKCIKNCHQNVLQLIDNGYCRYAIVRYLDKCNGCGKCVDVCKTKAMRMIVKECS